MTRRSSQPKFVKEFKNTYTGSNGMVYECNGENATQQGYVPVSLDDLFNRLGDDRWKKAIPSFKSYQINHTDIAKFFRYLNVGQIQDLHVAVEPDKTTTTKIFYLPDMHGIFIRENNIRDKVANDINIVREQIDERILSKLFLLLNNANAQHYELSRTQVDDGDKQKQNKQEMDEYIALITSYINTYKSLMEYTGKTPNRNSIINELISIQYNMTGGAKDGFTLDKLDKTIAGYLPFDDGVY